MGELLDRKQELVKKILALADPTKASPENTLETLEYNLTKCPVPFLEMLYAQISTNREKTMERIEKVLGFKIPRA